MSWGITKTQVFLALDFLWEISWRGEDAVLGSEAVLCLCWVPPSEHSHHTLGEGAGTKIRAGLT